jgi:outer membrane protein TolC
MRLALAAATAVAGLVSVSVSIARADDADAPYAPPDFLREEPVLPGGGDGAWRLDLAGAIQLAVTNNLRVVMERETVTLADLGISSATAQFEPLLSASYAHASATTPPTTLQAGVVGTLYTQVGDTWTVGANERFQTGTSVQIGATEVRTSSTLGTAPEPLNYFSQLSLGVTQPVLHGFSTDGTIQRIDILRATIGSDKERKQLAVTIADVVEKTEDAYWELVRAIHGYDLAVRTEKVATDQLALTHRQIDAGLSPSSDVIAAESTVAQRQLAVVQGEDQIQAAADALRAQLNLPRGDWARPILPTDAPRFDPQDASADDALAQALANRPELASADLDLRAAALSVRKADNDKLPELDLGAQVSLIGEDARFGGATDQLASADANQWQLTASFSWTPLQRATSAQQAAARANARQTALQRESLVQSIWLEVRDAVRSQRSKAREVIAAARARELAEQTLAIEQRRFVNSQSSTFVIAGRQQELASAQLAELGAVLDHQRASAALLRATGRLLAARHVELK